MEPERLKLALDELRMQMLGAQVLFGFQFQGLFQDRFQQAANTVRTIAVLGAALLVATIGLLIAVPCVHRLRERGEATSYIFHCAQRFAQLALAVLALALSANVYVVTTMSWHERVGVLAAAGSVAGCVFAWFALGILVRRRLNIRRNPVMSKKTSTPLQVRIDYMLTEARVILPGAQAMLGFDFIVTMTRGFGVLPAPVQACHFAALACITIAVLLLIAPAALHRLAFDGSEDERFLVIGSRLVTLALVPLMLGIAADMYVAVYKVYERPIAGGLASAGALVLLGSLWYVFPYWLRGRRTAATAH